jgi:hypothetical protein
MEVPNSAAVAGVAAPGERSAFTRVEADRRVTMYLADRDVPEVVHRRLPLGRENRRSCPSYVRMASREPMKQDRKDRLDHGVPRNFFVYVALVLTAGFLCFSLLGYVAGYSDLSDGMKADARLFLKDICFALGTACVVSLVFGVLLELPVTSDFVARKLSDLIFGDEYLRRIRPSLPDLKKRIDRVLLGEEELASQHGLYNFMENRLEALYKSSVRRNMSSEIRCIEQESQLLWKHKTSYTYVHNRLDTIKAVIMSQRSLDIRKEWLPRNTEASVEAFNKIVSRLKVQIGPYEYESSDRPPHPQKDKQIDRRDAGKFDS